MVDETRPKKKVIESCVYCSNPPDGQEHWLNRSLGTFAGNTFLTGRICTPCNVKFGGTIDLDLVRTVIATADGEQQMRFPRGWNEQQLRSAARILSGHSLTQRTETAICFWPWG
jgi:hypothetical protein